MAAANDRQGRLLQNLQDAMCPEEMTRECIGLAEAENERDMLRLLEEHRKEVSVQAYRPEQIQLRAKLAHWLFARSSRASLVLRHLR